VLAAAIVLLDQVTKTWAASALAGSEIIRPLGSDLIWLVLVKNPGLIFGMRWLPPVVLAVIALVAAIALAVYIGRSRDLTMVQALPLALIMAGATGNMIDRMLYGYVIDFLSVDLPDFLMERWPVFNVADSAVSLGVTALLILSFTSPSEGVSDQSPSAADADAAAPVEVARAESVETGAHDIER